MALSLDQYRYVQAAIKPLLVSGTDQRNVIIAAASATQEAEGISKDLVGVNNIQITGVELSTGEFTPGILLRFQEDLHFLGHLILPEGKTNTSSLRLQPPHSNLFILGLYEFCEPHKQLLIRPYVLLDSIPLMERRSPADYVALALPDLVLLEKPHTRRDIKSPQEFARLIRTERERLGLTREELADKIQAHPHEIKAFESLRSYRDVFSKRRKEVLERIGQFLKIMTEALIFLQQVQGFRPSQEAMNLERVRKESGINEWDLRRDLGINRAAFVQMEKGRKPITKELAIRFARYFKKDYRLFYKENDPT